MYIGIMSDGQIYHVGRTRFSLSHSSFDKITKHVQRFFIKKVGDGLSEGIKTRSEL